MSQSLNESQFQNIPHITNEMIKKLHEQEGISYLPQLIELSKEGKLREVMKKVDKTLKESELDDIEDCVNYVPDVSFKAFVTGFDSDKMEKDETKKLAEGEEALVSVNIKRENSKYPLAVEMQRYNKIKDCSWWVMVADPKKNELLAIKKISFKDKLRKDLQINLPQSFKESPKIEIYLVSDSYIGLDQVRVFKFNDEESKK